MNGRPAPRAITKVLHYTDATGYGGAESMLLTLLRGLDRGRWLPVLMYHSSPQLERLAREASSLGVEVVAVPEVGRAHGTEAILELRRLIRKLDPDIFHAHLPWGLRCTRGLLAAVTAGVPHRVATQQLFVPYSSARKRRRQLAISFLVHRYIAVSHAMARNLSPLVSRARKVRVIHNGVDTAAFRRGEGTDARAELGGRNGRPIVLCIARLESQKGLESMIAVAARVPRANFVVAGEGPDRPRLQALIEQNRLTDRFRLVGHRKDVPELLAACAVFVLPSLYEGLPVSVLEAMAAGRPVVATAVEGTDEAVVDQVTGLLVPAGDVEALAAAVQRLLDDRDLGRRLSSAALTHVERHFSARELVTRVERVYGELIGYPLAAPRQGRLAS